MNIKSILTSFIVMFLYGGLYFASYNQNRRIDTTDQAISVNNIKGDYQYLSLSDLKQILNLQDHDAQAIQRILTEINPQWAFQGEDTGEIFLA